LSRSNLHPLREKYRFDCVLKQDLFKQKKQLADATRSLHAKETKKAREDVRIATDKIENYLERLSDLKPRRPSPE
jgi:hypothetical protein